MFGVTMPFLMCLVFEIKAQRVPVSRFPILYFQMLNNQELSYKWKYALMEMWLLYMALISLISFFKNSSCTF